jgi:hypothetical protein
MDTVVSQALRISTLKSRTADRGERHKLKKPKLNVM